MAKKKKDKKPETPPEEIPEFDDEEYDDFDEFADGFLMDSMFGSGDDNFDMNAYWNEPDFLLADIVNAMVNIGELEIGITLFIKGMTLTGTLTSERQYLRDLTDTFRSRIHMKKPKGKMSKKERAAIDEMFNFTRFSESGIAQELDEDGMDMPDHFPTIRFLHLKNPIQVGQNGIVDFGQGPIPYIRLRLSLIDGWMLGEIASPEMFKDDNGDEVLH